MGNLHFDSIDLPHRAIDIVHTEFCRFAMIYVKPPEQPSRVIGVPVDPVIDGFEEHVYEVAERFPDTPLEIFTSMGKGQIILQGTMWELVDADRASDNIDKLSERYQNAIVVVGNSSAPVQRAVDPDALRQVYESMYFLQIWQAFLGTRNYISMTSPFEDFLDANLHGDLLVFGSEPDEGCENLEAQIKAYRIVNCSLSATKDPLYQRSTLMVIPFVQQGFVDIEAYQRAMNLIN